MTDEEDYTRRGFVAERRSLLVVSFVLFFYQQAGLQIEKINVFGNEAKISDPWWIAFALWILWGYFLIRFYQYFQSIPDKGFWTAHELQNEKLIIRSAFKHFKRDFMDREAQQGRKYNFKQTRDPSFPSRHPHSWTVRLEVSIVMTDETGTITASGSRHEEDFTFTKLLWIKIRSFVHVLISTHIATEYFLPFLLALLPLANLLRTLL